MDLCVTYKSEMIVSIQIILHLKSFGPTIIHWTPKRILYPSNSGNERRFVDLT